MSVNASRDNELGTFYEERARRQVWIGNVPGSMTPRTVAVHLESNGFGTQSSVFLSRGEGLMGDTQSGVVTFCSEASATILRQAGQNRRALLWPDGRSALIRPALVVGIIPGDRHQKAGGYAAQKASKRQFCG